MKGLCAIKSRIRIIPYTVKLVQLEIENWYILWGSSDMAIDSWENIHGCVKNHKHFTIYVANLKHKHQWRSQVELVEWTRLNN